MSHCRICHRLYLLSSHLLNSSKEQNKHCFRILPVVRSRECPPKQACSYIHILWYINFTCHFYPPALLKNASWVQTIWSTACGLSAPHPEFTIHIQPGVLQLSVNISSALFSWLTRWSRKRRAGFGVVGPSDKPPGIVTNATSVVRLFLMVVRP